MRDAVRDLVALGRFSEASATAPVMARRVELLDEIRLQAPTGEEIAALITLFPPDHDPHNGLSFTLVHGIEACPEWPVWPLLEAHTGWWIDLLGIRLKNAGDKHP